MLAVGQAAIDLTPLPVKDFAISTFGADDKNALLVGILVILAAFAAVIGILAVRRLALGLLGLGGVRLHRPGRRADPADRDRRIRDPDPGRRRGRRLRADPPGPRGARARFPAGPVRTRRPSHSRLASSSRPTCPGLGERREAAPASSFTFLPNPDDRGAVPVAGAAAVPDHQRARRGDRGGGRAGRARADHPAQRQRGARRAALPQAGGRRSPAPARQQPEHPRPQLVHHPERELLPRRHRPAAARGRPGDLAAAHPRHGAARGDA